MGVKCLELLKHKKLQANKHVPMFAYPPLILVHSSGNNFYSLQFYLLQKFIGEDDFSADYIDEGKTLMKRERRIRERNLRDDGRTVSCSYLRLMILV